MEHVSRAPGRLAGNQPRGLFFHPTLIRAMAVLPLHIRDVAVFPIDSLIQLAHGQLPPEIGVATW